MSINVTTSKQQITASVAEDRISANVSAGFGATGPQGPSGVITVTAPITNAGTTTAANVGISVGTGLTVSGGALVLGTHTHDDRYYTETEVNNLLAGYATLVGGKVPASQLPSYVDDVIEVATYGDLPSPGESGKIYLVLQTNKVYRWTGFVWLEIVASPGSTDSLAEGSVNLYYTNARASAAAPVQSVAGKTGAVVLAASDIASGTLSASRLPIAASGTLGAVRIGSGISIDGDGVISASSGYTLPTASTTVKGGVKVDGTSVSIDGNGVISVSTNYAAATHTHAISDVTGLSTALSDIDGALSGKAAAGDAFPYSLTLISEDYSQTISRTQSGSSITLSETVTAGGVGSATLAVDYASYAARLTLSGNGDLYGNAPTTTLTVTNNAITFPNAVVFDGTYASLGSKPTLFDGAYTSLTSVPSTFAPSAHNTSHATGGSDALSPSDIGAASQLHAHGAITSDGKIGTTAGLVLQTGTAGAVEALAQGTAGQVLKVNSGATGVEWGAAAADVSIDTTAADILSASSGSITADDPGADRIVFWDDSAGKLTYLSAGTNITITDTTISAAGSTSASDLTSGTLGFQRLPARVRSATSLYLWSSFR